MVTLDEALLESEWNHAIVVYENLRMISLLKKRKVEFTYSKKKVAWRIFV